MTQDKEYELPEIEGVPQAPSDAVSHWPSPNFGGARHLKLDFGDAEPSLH